MLTRKFSRTKDHRDSLLKNLATSVLLYERVVTTSAKAKEIRSVVERLINVGKEGLTNQGGLTSYRRLRSELFDPKAAKKIIEELAPRYKNIIGGYVTVLPMGRRSSDGAAISVVELRSVPESERGPVVTEKERKEEKAEKPAKPVKAIKKKPVKPPTQKKSTKTKEKAK